MIEIKDRNRLKVFLEKWIKQKIYQELESLIKLKFLNNNNSAVRALAYNLYENNGVVKRENVKNILDKLGQGERKILREAGIKFGRYHIFLFKLFKPNAVSLRILLWKNFYQKYFNLEPPVFGLNFLENKKILIETLCFFVDLKILEKFLLGLIS